MKHILPLIIALSLTSTGLAWPWDKKPTPGNTNTVTTPVIVKSTNAIADAKGIIVELQNELKDTKKENDNLTNLLNQTRTDLDQSFAEVTQLNKEIKDLKEWAVIQQAEAHKFMEKYNKAVKRYHRLKMIAAAIAAIVGVFIGMQFMSLAPPPYNFGVPFGAAGLFASLVWFFL